MVESDILGLMPKLVGSFESVVRSLQTTDYKVKLGFTLIEFLIVLGVLAVAIGSSLLVLTSVLRGSNQANITSEVKQNGQATLDSIEGQIRNANDARDLLPLPAGASDGVALTLSDGTSASIACFPAGANTNGSIKLLSGIVTSYTSLTNQDTVSGVDVTDCSFSVISATTGAQSPAIVKVSFVANQGIAAPSRQDFKANVKFETTISLRRY